MKQLAAKKKVWSVILTMVLLAVLSVQTAVAAPAQDEKVSLTINAYTGGKGISGVEWSVYQVAEMPYIGVYTLTSTFATSGLDVESLNGATADDMQKSAAKMVSFVSENQIRADRSADTNKKGTAVLEDMEKGLYLVCQSGNKNTDMIVKSQPFFVSLPMMKNTDGTYSLQYDVVAAPKLEVTVPETTVPETTVPETTVPETTVPDETTVPETSVPETSVPDETTVPETSVPETSVPETNPSRPSTNTSGSPGGSSTTTITDGLTPLASFLPPQTPDDMDLIIIEDGPVPLGDFPFIPKMGDMGSGSYAMGIILSSILGVSSLIRRKKYTGEEE